MTTIESPARLLTDRQATELVDALAAAIDPNRYDDVTRVSRALRPLGLSTQFGTELRLNGSHSCCYDCSLL